MTSETAETTGTTRGADAPPPPAVRYRDARQRSVVPPAKLAAVTAVVIGVGAIGRPLGLQLAAVGVPRMILVDPDVVEVENLASQAWAVEQLGGSKVLAAAVDCRRLNPAGLELKSIAEKFRRPHLQELPVDRAAGGRLAVFCCVDSIETREFLWRACRPSADLWVDGRMAAETCRVISTAKPKEDKYYETTLFAGGEAFAAPCTARSTAYCGNHCAAAMTARLTRWLRDMPVGGDVQFNLLTDEVQVLREPFE